jgi:proline-, glutamic acid- and leucine-rich protein 1
MENVMKEALSDVTPASDEVCLMMPETGGKSNKKKKISAEKIMKRRMTTLNISDEQNVCIKALAGLEALLVYQGVLMKPVLFYIMQEKITSISFMITSRIQRDSDLYRDPHCRIKLVDLVEKMMTHPVNKMPVPVNYGIAILGKIKKDDPDTNVRDNAEMCLSRIETVLHNRKDVFYFPADYKDFKDTLMFNKQTVMKFNETKKLNGTSEVNGNKEEVNGNEVVEMNETVEILNPPPADVAEEESEEEETQEQENSAAEENNQEEEEVEEPEIIAPAPSRQSSRTIKRTSPPETVKKTPKKQKVCAKGNDDELVDEMLADFNE